MIRIKVVLPAPFGPSRPITFPGGHVEVDVVEHHAIAETLGHAAHDERVGHFSTLSSRVGRC